MKLFAVFLFCLIALPSLAATAIDGDTFTQNGTTYRIANILAPKNDESKIALQKLLDAQDPAPAAIRVMPNGETLVSMTGIADQMIASGNAHPFPLLADDHYADLVKLDKSQPYTPETAYKMIDSFGVVEGIPLKAASAGDRMYLNFGDDWRRDFTIQLTRQAVRELQKQDIDWQSLAGRKLRVRGWVERRNGPMITVITAKQLELL